MAMRRVWLVIERRMRGGKEKSPRERKRNECRRRRMTTIQRFMTVGKKLSQKPPGTKKRRRRKGISLVLHTRVSGPDPSLCVCVSNIPLHILPGTLTSCKRRQTRRRRRI
jgi:hypothetical protein